MKDSEILKQALTLLDDGKNWTGLGGDLCISTAITKTHQPTISILEREWTRLHKYLFPNEIFTTYSGPTYEWNDDPERTWDEVKQRFLDAIQRAEQDEAKHE